MWRCGIPPPNPPAQRLLPKVWRTIWRKSHLASRASSSSLHPNTQHESRETCQNHPGPGKEALCHLDQAGKGPQHKGPLGGTTPAEYLKNIPETLQKKWVCEHIIFLVCSLDSLLHDFPDLKDILHRDLSDIWRHVPWKTCPTPVRRSIKTPLQKRIALQGFQDTLGVQGEDDVKWCLNAYHSLFGMDDDSL